LFIFFSARLVFMISCGRTSDRADSWRRPKPHGMDRRWRVISIVNRRGSNGNDSSIKQILRHLRTLVHGLRVPKKWLDPRN